MSTYTAIILIGASFASVFTEEEFFVLDVIPVLKVFNLKAHSLPTEGKMAGKRPCSVVVQLCLSISLTFFAVIIGGTTFA